MKDFKIKRYDYGREQKRRRTVKATVVTAILAAGALAAGWFLYPPVYRFVTEFEFPAAQGPDSSQPSPAPSVPSSAAQSPSSGSGEEEMDFPQSAAYLPLEVVKDPQRLTSSLASLSAKGVDGVLFDLKDPDGMVHYKSSLELVESNRAQSQESYDLGEVISQIRGAGLTPVGRIYAFRDHTATAHMYESAVKYMNSKVNWIDEAKANGGKSWLNPNNREAQDYILALVEEAAESGLSAIVLDGVQFPEGVALELATYQSDGPLDKSQVLAGFLTRARGTAEAKNCRIAATVNLMSATGLSGVRYGDDVGSLLTAAGCGVVEVMPEQFGNGVTSEALTLSAPALDPYRTVSQALAAAEDSLPVEEVPVVAMVQAYTSAVLSESQNKVYGPEEVQAQVRAAQEAGIRQVLYLNPQGDYSMLG